MSRGLGDVYKRQVIGVANQEVHDLAAFFRAVWALGPAGVEVPLDIHRDGAAFEVIVQSVDRSKKLKGPVVH